MEINYFKQKTKNFASDLDLTFLIHPIKKDLSISADEQAIKNSVKNLVLTNHYERLFHPEIGSNVSKLLFENNSPLLKNHIENEIFNAITNFEPRVRLISIDVQDFTEQNNAYFVTITYYALNATVESTIDIVLEKLR